MLKRFEGKDGQRLITGLLCEQQFVGGDQSLAATLLSRGELIELPLGDEIITQHASDNEMYFIVSGSCDVLVNGHQVATRRAGTYVGEMALIQPGQRRAATVRLAEESVLLKVSETAFAEIADGYPQLWQRIAKELARRLEQRNTFVTESHEQIRIFIMSSAESLDIARAIQNAFEHDAYLVTVWTDGVFRASSYPLDVLKVQLDQSDFAVAVASPDDSTLVRGTTWPTTRDNVVFELGYFMGRIGRLRSVLVERRGEEVKLPSDLSGLTTLPYKWNGERKDLPAAIAPVCNRIREIVQEMGPNN